MGLSSNFMESRLFKPFERDCTNQIGTGLGLSIAHRLATQIGGQVGALQKKKGSTFFLKFPVSLTDSASFSVLENVGHPSIDAKLRYPKHVDRTVTRTEEGKAVNIIGTADVLIVDDMALVRIWKFDNINFSLFSIVESGCKLKIVIQFDLPD
jgi:hypothetical protein